MSQRENSPVTIAADFLTGFAAAALPAAERLATSRHYRRLPRPRYVAFWDGRAAATAAPLGRYYAGAADPAALAAGRAWFETALAALPSVPRR